MKKLVWVYKALILCLVLVSFSGCARVAMRALGINQPKLLSDARTARVAKRYGIPFESSFILDTNYYGYFKAMDSTRLYPQIKNHLQPLQALYYNRAGKLISFHVNCYAGGRFNLEWDRDSLLSEFPPRQQAPLDSLLSLETLLEYMILLENTQQVFYKEYDYTVVVHWSRFLGRQSKRLIDYVQSNAELKGNKSVRVLYVNNDSFFGGVEMEIVR